MRSEIIRDISRFKEISKQWNDAVSRSPTDTFFLANQWLSSWWDNFGDGQDLLVILLWDGDDIAAAAPFMVKHVRKGGFTISRVLQFISHELSDYLDLVITTADPGGCFSELMSLADREPWDYAKIGFIRGASDFRSLWRSSEYFVGEEKADVSVSSDISGFHDWDSYIRSRDKKLRQDMTRLGNNLNKAGRNSIEVFSGSREICALLQNLYTIHTAKWSGEGFPGQFRDPRWQRHFESVAESLDGTGVVEYSVLKLDEEFIAVHYGFSYHGTYYWYIPTYNPAFARFSPGKLLIAALIRRSIDQGLKTFDLLRGSEKYKYFWGDTTSDLYRVTLLRKALLSRCRFHFEATARSMMSKSFVVRTRGALASIFHGTIQ